MDSTMLWHSIDVIIQCNMSKFVERWHIKPIGSQWRSTYYILRGSSFDVCPKWLYSISTGPLFVAKVSQQRRNYAGKQGKITKFNMFAHVIGLNTLNCAGKHGDQTKRFSKSREKAKGPRAETPTPLYKPLLFYSI